MVFNTGRSRITRTTGQDEERAGSCVRNAIAIVTIAGFMAGEYTYRWLK